MKKVVLLTMVLFAATFGNAQNKENDSINLKNKKTMRTFDIEKYRSYIKEHNGHANFTYEDENGMIIRPDNYSKDINGKWTVVGYREECSRPNSPYTYVYEYNRKGELNFEVCEFYGFGIEKSTRYDDEGNIIEIKYFDTPYPFSVDSLITKMQREYGVNILNKRRIRRCTRYVAEEMQHPFYEIWAWADGKEDVANEVDCYIIDGTDGRTLLKTRRKWHYMGVLGNQERPFDEYLRHEREKKDGTYVGEGAMLVPGNRLVIEGEKHGFWARLFGMD